MKMADEVAGNRRTDCKPQCPACPQPPVVFLIDFQHPGFIQSHNDLYHTTHQSHGEYMIPEGLAFYQKHGKAARRQQHIGRKEKDLNPLKTVAQVTKQKLAGDCHNRICGQNITALYHRIAQLA